MGVRRQAREAALQALFMCDFQSRWDDEQLEIFFSHFELPASVNEYARKLVEGVRVNLEGIDAKIATASEHWSVSRMARTDRNIIRMTAYEISFQSDVPVSVAINEAIEIARRFGSEDSPTFVNGVLDRIAASEPLARRTEIESISVDAIAGQKEAVFTGQNEWSEEQKDTPGHPNPSRR